MILSILSLYIVIEGYIVLLECRVIVVNFNFSIIWRWYKIDNFSNVFYNGLVLEILNIKKNRLGMYSCIVSNDVGILEVVDINIDV